MLKKNTDYVTPFSNALYKHKVPDVDLISFNENNNDNEKDKKKQEFIETHNIKQSFLKHIIEVNFLIGLSLNSCVRLNFKNVLNCGKMTLFTIGHMFNFSNVCSCCIKNE